MIVGGHNVANAITTLLQEHLDATAVLVDPRLSVVRSWDVLPDGERGVGHVSPAVLVAPQGVDYEPAAYGDGLQGAVTVGVMVFVEATTPRTALDLVAKYCAAIRAVLTAWPLAADWLGTLTVVREDWNAIPANRDVEGRGMVTVRVLVPVMNPVTVETGGPVARQIVMKEHE